VATLFDLELTEEQLAQIFEHAEREYPREACGVVIGDPAAPRLARVEPLRNVQDRYHRLDPVRFPRDARDAFRVDELERMRMLERIEAEGMVERVLYHSHCDAGAYFSPEDRALAVQDGLELLPGVLHLVVSIRDGRRRDAAVYRWDRDRRCFDEQRVPASTEGPPDLAARAMEGREAARPIRPVAGALAPRLVTADEARRLLAGCADRATIDPAAGIEIRRLALGYWSPLPGFMTAADAQAAVEGRLIVAGVPWREPLVLEVDRRPSGRWVALCGPDGAPVAAIELTEVTAAGERFRLAGPVYAFETGGEPTAADVRAELVRRGWTRVLAMADAGGLDQAPPGVDGVLAARAARWVGPLVLPSLAGRGWAQAVMAQNAGATEVWVDDGEDTPDLEGLAVGLFRAR
jgi:proteasome lid subunit RPN8/RPN11